MRYWVAYDKRIAIPSVEIALTAVVALDEQTSEEEAAASEARAALAQERAAAAAAASVEEGERTASTEELDAAPSDKADVGQGKK